jgi:hypothetical protein
MIEIVITGRHDDYGGPDFVDRLCAAAEHNRRVLDAAGVAHAFTLVEWNPITGRTWLAEIVKQRLPWWERCLVVDPVWHQRLSTNPRLQFMEFFGKNAAIRRSSADAVLTTNSDVFLSTEVAQALAARVFDDRTVYRAVRIDIDRTAPWQEGEAVFANTAHHVRINEPVAPDYGNSAGDFLLLTPKAWHALGGFNERVRYAKIHKDGQFCYNAWLEGFRFDVLGRIYHIDHDGSYANAGALHGSPDAHYGPEWNYRTSYRNPRSWGLSSAIDGETSPGTVHVAHPSTHGPVLSVIAIGNHDASEAESPSRDLEIVNAVDSADLASTVNDALARTHGRFVVVTDDVHLTEFGGRHTLVETLRRTTAGLVVPAGMLKTHRTLGRVPAAGAPFVFRRDLIDAFVEWDETQPNPAMAFWLRAAELTTPAEMMRTTGVVTGTSPTIGAALEAGTLQRRGAQIDEQTWDTMVREHLTSAGTLRGLVASWLDAHVPAGNAGRCAIVGPDWATPLLIEALRGSNRECVGVFTAATREDGTSRWGERLQALSQIVASGATHVVTAHAAISARVAAVGCEAIVCALSGAVPSQLNADAELDVLRRAQAHDVAAMRVDRVLARLPLLSQLEGVDRWQHWYDAAQVVERAGRIDEALRLFKEVMKNGATGATRVLGQTTDVALQMRATFHVGRLLIDGGEPERAAMLLTRVVRHNPAHRAAKALLDELKRRAMAERDADSAAGGAK